MLKQQIEFNSARIGATINGVIWTPSKPIVGIVQITHGLTEHIGRYEALAEYLTDKGYAVAGIDLLGHGRSVFNDLRGYFGTDGSWFEVLEDIHFFKDSIKTAFNADVPYFMLGFSLGSFLVRTYMSQYASENDINGYILLGTGYQSPALLKLLRLVVKHEAKQIGETNSSPLIKQLSFGSYNKFFAPNKTDFDWICGDEDALNEYIADEMCYKTISAGLFRELLTGMIYSCNPRNIAKVNQNVPVKLMSGADDPVGDKGKGVMKACNAFKKAGVKSITTSLYPDVRHDVLHDKKSRDSAYESIYKWMQEVIHA